MEHGVFVKQSMVRAALPFIVPILFVVGWWYLSGLVDNPIILPTVKSVIAIFSHPSEELIGVGSLLDNIVISLARVVAGYCAAIVIAVPLGILMGSSAPTYRLLNTFLGLFRPIPPLAWVPLVLAWFGVASLATLAHVEYGTWYVYLNNLKLSMIFIIFIGAFFPVLTSSIYGVRNVRKALIDSARMLGAREHDLFLKILLPAAAPSIVNGMRIGLGVAWMCLVSAEMLPGSIAGVGYLITHAFTVARTDIVIAGMVSIGSVGACMDLLFRRYEEKKFKWQRLSR